MRARIGKLAIAIVAAIGLTLPVKAGEVLERVMSKKTLVNAVEGEYPPFNSIGDNNEIIGFDIDVAKEVAKRMGVELQTITQGWDVITAGRWAGRWDIAISSMANTKARQEVLEFPAVYYYTPAVILVHQDNNTIHSLKDLSGKKVGVQVGTTNEKFFQKKLEIGDKPLNFDFENVAIVSYDNEPLLIDDLSLGDGVRFDAISIGPITATEYIKNGKPLKIVGQPLFNEEASIAVDKGDPEFAAKIKEVIEAMRADGTLQKLSEERFGIDITAPPTGN